MNKFRPLDIVRVNAGYQPQFSKATTKDAIGVITTVSGSEYSIDWFGETSLHNAWWRACDLEYVDNLANFLTKAVWSSGCSRDGADIYEREESDSKVKG